MINKTDKDKIHIWIRLEAVRLNNPEVYIFCHSLIDYINSISGPHPVGRPRAAAKIDGKKLRKLRKEKGLVQRDIAKILGFTDARITQFETGSAGNRISLDALIQIADYLEVDYAALLIKEPNHETETPKD